MTDADFLRGGFASLQVNADFSQATLSFRDGSALHFVHRVGQRTANASADATQATQVLSRIARFRLNAKHLEMVFLDGSQWEAHFANGPKHLHQPDA